MIESLPTAFDLASIADEYAAARAKMHECATLLGLPLPTATPPAPDYSDDSSDAATLPACDVNIHDLTNPPGLVGRIVDWIEASAERPNRALYLAAALAFVGTLAGRKFASPSDLRTNLYFVTLAPSGHGKDHAIRQIKRLSEAANLDRYIGPARIMSASALRNLAKRERSVVCLMDEFGGFMRQIHDRRAGIHNQLIKLDLLEFFSSAATSFSGAEYASEPATKIYAPNLSISGTSTPADFWASLSSMSTLDGLLARIILLNVDGPKPARRVPPQGPRDVPASIVEECRGLAELGGRRNLDCGRGDAPDPTVVDFDFEAAVLFDQFTQRIDTAEESSDETPLTRVREHAIKLAVTVAAGENPNQPIITAETFLWASQLALLSATTLMGEARDRIADNDREAAYNRIIEVIKKGAKAGVTEGRIRDRTRGIDQRVYREIISDLQSSGRVRLLRKDVGSKGRPSERWVFVR